MHAAVAIRQRRLEAQIGRREQARRAGTSPATLLRYERGEISPGSQTLERILDSVLPKRRWPSLPSLVPSLLEAFEQGLDSWAWRTACEILDDESTSTPEETRLFVSRRPDLTGNDRVDALVAAFAEHVCVERGIAAPPWAWEPRVCTPWWFVAGLPAFEGRAMHESPPSFASRGIFVTRRDLMKA
jgi:transcriptional regulator with XRE-family HTH domain